MSPLASSSVGAKTFQPWRSRTLRGDLRLNNTDREAGAQKAIVAADSKSVTLPAQLLLKSVGYKSVALKGVPFDSLRSCTSREGSSDREADMSVWGGHCKESNKDDAEASSPKMGNAPAVQDTTRCSGLSGAPSKGAAGARAEVRGSVFGITCLYMLWAGSSGA